MEDVPPPPLSPETISMVAHTPQMEATDCKDVSETTCSNSVTGSSCVGKTKASKAISSRKRKLEMSHLDIIQEQNEHINKKMNELHDLIPNSYKVDEDSMLDDVIQYLKFLQCQYQMMCSFSGGSIMGMPSPWVASPINQAFPPPPELNISVGIAYSYPLGIVYGVIPRTMSYAPTTSYGWESIPNYECNDGLQISNFNSMLKPGDKKEAHTNIEGNDMNESISRQQNRASIGNKTIRVCNIKYEKS